MTPEEIKALEALLNELLADDTRTPDLRGRFAAAHGRKRTNLECVTILPLGGAAPVQDIVQQEPTDAGDVFVAVLDGLLQPFDYNAVVQWILADCGLLTAIMCAAGLDPFYFRRLIVADPADKTRVIVQAVWNGLIIRVHATLLVSSSYNAGSPANPSSVIVELYEKVTGLVRTGVSTYAGANWGWGAGIGMRLLGLSASTVAAGAQVNAAAIAAALAAGKAVGLNTTSAPVNAPSWWRKDHVIKAEAANLAKGTVSVRDPWHGGELVTVSASDITPQLFLSIDAGAIASPPIFAAPAPVIVPAVPAVAAGTGLSITVFPDSVAFTPTALGLPQSAANFNYAAGQVLGSKEARSDYMSMILAGSILAPATGSYTLMVTASGTTKQQFNRQACPAAWVTSLVAGTRYPIEIDWANSGGAATLKLEWIRPDGTREVIPASQLFPE